MKDKYIKRKRKIRSYWKRGLGVIYLEKDFNITTYLKPKHDYPKKPPY